MEKDIKDSIKARLWDFKYTPFLSSYIFAWLYWNSKLILIFISKDLNVQKKIEMLSWNNVNYMTPLYCALAYVFVYPFVNAIFYAVTLFYKAIMNKIQQWIQDKTPLPQERANEIIKKNTELELEYTKISESIEKMKLDYANKTTELITLYTNKENNLNELVKQKEENLQYEIDRAITSAIEKHKNQNAEIAKELNIARSTIIGQTNQITNLKQELVAAKTKTLTETILESTFKNNNQRSLLDKALDEVKNSSNPDIKDLTESQIIVLIAFYENDSTMTKSALKNFANQKYSLSRVIVDTRINELTSLGYITFNGTAIPTSYSLNKKGREIVETLFS